MPNAGKLELFDLSRDLSEQNNVASEFPEIVSDLHEKVRLPM